jgi:hypothetical protein
MRRVGEGCDDVTSTGNPSGTTASGLASQRVWHELGRSSFAVLSYTNPRGAPRSSGVVYAVADRTMYVVVGADSWKARHIALCGQIAVTVPVRRGGVMSLLLPIPPATISFQAAATVHPAGASDVAALPKQLVRLLPTEGRSASCIIEIHPQGWFVTYGVGVPLMRMRHPALARGRVRVDQP